MKMPRFGVYGRKGFDASPDESGMIRKASHMPLDVKSIEEDGTIIGYGSKWDFVDSYGEAVKKGAFTTSLKERNGEPFPMLWQHRSDTPIGVWTDYKEDSTGLALKGTVNKETQRGREAFSDIKMKAVRGLSIGYFEVVVDSWEEARKNGVRNLWELDLREVSPVTFPALQEASIDAIKARKAHGQIPTLREFEEALREKLLLSRADAQFIAANGFKALILRESDGATDGTDSEVLEALKALEFAPLQLPVF